MYDKMNAKRSLNVKDRLIEAATSLVRKQGYVATTVDQICTEAGVTKGAFFHHFKSKEQLAEACLTGWDQMGEAIDQQACVGIAKELGEDADPVDVVLRFMDSISSMFGDPKLLKSCLAGTIAQEIGDGNEVLREAARSCFANAEQRLKSLLDAACKSRRIKLDTASLASLWLATMQGSLILCKASGDQGVTQRNLKQITHHIAMLLGEVTSTTLRKKANT